MPRRPISETDKCKSIAISFTPEDYDRIRSYCERNDRPLAWVVRQALRVWLEAHKDDRID